MNSPPPLRLALVGLGRMGRFHLRTLSGSDDVEIVAVVEPSAASIEAGSGHLGAARVVPDVRDLEPADAVEAWLVSSPTPTHPALVSQALGSGIHVLCEKPLALDPEEGDALGEEARRAGLVLQLGFWRRFSPPWVHARRLIAGGGIGRPLMVRLSQWDADPPPAAFCDPEVSGGLAVDCGVHEFDLAEWLTGDRVVAVRGHHLPLVDESLASAGDVDNLLAVLHLARGAMATVDLSRNARYGDDVRTEVLGSEGALFVDLLPTGRTRIGTAEGVSVVPGSEVEDATAAGVAGQARAFAAAVRGEAVEIPGAAAGTRSVRIARAVARSAAEATEITVSPSD